MDSQDKKENQVAQNGVHIENSDPIKKVDNGKAPAKPGKCSSPVVNEDF